MLAAAEACSKLTCNHSSAKPCIIRKVIDTMAGPHHHVNCCDSAQHEPQVQSWIAIMPKSAHLDQLVLVVAQHCIHVAVMVVQSGLYFLCRVITPLY